MRTSALPHVVIEIPPAQLQNAAEVSTELQPVAEAVRPINDERSSARAAFQTDILKRQYSKRQIAGATISAIACLGSIAMLADGARRLAAVPAYTTLEGLGGDVCIGEGCDGRTLGRVEVALGAFMVPMFTFFATEAISDRS